MNLFPQQPKVSKDDTLRIFPKLANRNVVRTWIRKTPDTDDLKRAVMIEVFRCINGGKSPLTAFGRGVYQDLLAAIMKRERSAIDDAVKDVLVAADRKRSEVELNNALVAAEHSQKKSTK